MTDLLDQIIAFDGLCLKEGRWHFPFCLIPNSARLGAAKIHLDHYVALNFWSAESVDSFGRCWYAFLTPSLRVVTWPVYYVQ